MRGEPRRQNKNLSRRRAGLDASHHIRFSPEGRGKNFSLDILFHRMSVLVSDILPFPPFIGLNELQSLRSEEWLTVGTSAN
jgi:hypothetical protein